MKISIGISLSISLLSLGLFLACAPASAQDTALIMEIQAGGYHSCARFDNGKVKCWGRNSSGQLGLGDTLPRGTEPGQMGVYLPYLELGNDLKAIQISVGYEHSCALFDNGAIKCWGNNNHGQLGLGDNVSRGTGLYDMGEQLSAVDLDPHRSAMQVSAGMRHTCAILDDGKVKCWGDNEYGQLGLEDTLPRGSAPEQMGAALPTVNLGTQHKALYISAGDFHTCALLDNGSIKCWGDNDFGQLGVVGLSPRGSKSGQMGDRLPVLDLGTGRRALQIDTGDHHTCALLDDGSIKCWGINHYGQLGLGDFHPRGYEAAQMGNQLPIIKLGAEHKAQHISIGDHHSCAILDNGKIKCWGYNDFGQLGLGDIVPRGFRTNQMGGYLPIVDLGLEYRAVKISAGVFHTCAILNDHSLKCWGNNNAGQLGLGVKDDRGDEPNEMGNRLPGVSLK